VDFLEGMLEEIETLRESNAILRRIVEDHGIDPNCATLPAMYTQPHSHEETDAYRDALARTARKEM
jgi:gamma-glutamyl:cysteine ligase YbdK (ATP-grasp superfamily)